MIYLTYRFDQYEYKVCDDVAQWDTEQIMKVSNLPHYCSYNITYLDEGKSVTTETKLVEDCLIRFPNECFFEPGTVHCYIQHEKDGETETIADISIFVKERKIPSNVSPADIRSGKYAVTSKGLIIGALPENGVFNAVITNKDDVIHIPAGIIDDGTVSLSEEERNNIRPEIIKEGESVLGVEGKYSLNQIGYDGETYVVPTKEQQVLNTKNKLVSDDITVDSIPEEYIIPEGEMDIEENGVYDVTETKQVSVQIPIPDGYIIPSGEIDITSNGDYDIKEYEKAKVNVPIPPEYIIPSDTIDITGNGVVDVATYKEANVNVPIPDGYIKPEGSMDINENGTFDVTEKAEVNVNTPPMQWQRPKDWLPYPEMSTEYDEIWMLVHVSKEYGAARIYQNDKFDAINKYMVDWGDGNVEEIDQKKTNAWQKSPNHFYNFDDLDPSTETEFGYRQCWCRGYRERGSLYQFQIGWEYLNLSNLPPTLTIVEIIVNASSELIAGKVYSMAYMAYLKHIKVIGDTTLTFNALNVFPILEYLEGDIVPAEGVSGVYNSAFIPYNEILYSFPEKKVTDGLNFAMSSRSKRIEVDCENVTTLQQAFYRATTDEIMLSNTDKCENFQRAFDSTTAKIICGLSLASATKIDYLYQNFNGVVENGFFNGLNGEKITTAVCVFYSATTCHVIPDMLIPNCTSINMIFRTDHIYEIGTMDISSVTSATDAFTVCKYLQKINFVEESIPISLNFSKCTILNLDSAKSIIKGLKNYVGTSKEFVYSIQFSAETLAILDADGETAPGNITWRDYAYSKGWNM